MSTDVLGQKLKYARHQKGLMQKEMADKLDVGRTTITNYENGTSRPNPKQIPKICDVLDVEKEWLLKTDDGFSYDVDEKEVKEQTTTEFGMKLRLLRKGKNLTLNDLGNILNIGLTGYARYEKGVADPSLDTLRKLSNFYNVSLDDLLGTSDTTKEEFENVFEDWIIEILNDRGNKRKAIKNIWNEIKDI